MDWSYKAVLTAAMVALLLIGGRTFGRRFAGALAGLPTVTGPALVWLAMEFGADYVVEAATGSIAACAACAVFALVYERVSRRAGAVVAMLLGCGASIACAASLPWLPGGLPGALAVAGASSWLVYRLIPDPRHEPTFNSPLRHEIGLTAVVAGTVSGAVALAAPQVGPFWAGVLASPPVIAAAVAMHQQVCDGQPATRRFLRGYVAGLVGRAVFGICFAMLIAPLGLLQATAAAVLAGCTFTAATLHVVRRSTTVGAAPVRAPRYGPLSQKERG